MRALMAVHLVISKGRIVVTEGANGVRLPATARMGNKNQLEPVQWTGEFLVQPNRSTRGQRVGFVAMATVKTDRFLINQVHEFFAFTTTTRGFTRHGERRKGRLKQSF